MTCIHFDFFYIGPFYIKTLEFRRVEKNDVGIFRIIFCDMFNKLVVISADPGEFGAVHAGVDADSFHLCVNLEDIFI